jgi:hypothetical protein
MEILKVFSNVCGDFLWKVPIRNIKVGTTVDRMNRRFDVRVAELEGRINSDQHCNQGPTVYGTSPLENVVGTEDRRRGRMTADKETEGTIIGLVEELIVGDVGLEAPKKTILPKVVGGVDDVYAGDRRGAMWKRNRGRAY